MKGYTVLSADRHFAEAGESALLLGRMNGRRIIPPADRDKYPAREYLAEHRKAWQLMS